MAPTQVPQLALCAVMLDLDRAVAASTIGADRFWIVPETAATHPVSCLSGADEYRRGLDTRKQGGC